MAYTGRMVTKVGVLAVLVANLEPIQFCRFRLWGIRHDDQSCWDRDQRTGFVERCLLGEWEPDDPENRRSYLILQITPIKSITLPGFLPASFCFKCDLIGELTRLSQRNQASTKWPSLWSRPWADHQR